MRCMHDGALACEIMRDHGFSHPPKSCGSAAMRRVVSGSCRVTKITAWRLAMRWRLSISNSAITLSTNSVNSTTRARRFRREFELGQAEREVGLLGVIGELRRGRAASARNRCCRGRGRDIGGWWRRRRSCRRDRQRAGPIQPSISPASMA